MVQYEQFESELGDWYKTTKENFVKSDTTQYEQFDLIRILLNAYLIFNMC